MACDRSDVRARRHSAWPGKSTRGSDETTGHPLAGAFPTKSVSRVNPRGRSRERDSVRAVSRKRVI